MVHLSNRDIHQHKIQVTEVYQDLSCIIHDAGYFDQVLQKHHTIGLPDRLTRIFELSRPVNQIKCTQNTYRVQACIKHWLKGNSKKFYNKSGCWLHKKNANKIHVFEELKLMMHIVNGFA